MSTQITDTEQWIRTFAETARSNGAQPPEDATVRRQKNGVWVGKCSTGEYKSTDAQWVWDMLTLAGVSSPSAVRSHDPSTDGQRDGTLNEPWHLDELWDQCFVADNEEDAYDQRHRQVAAYIDKVVYIDRCMAQLVDHDDNNFAPVSDMTMFDFKTPLVGLVIGLWDEFDWDGTEAIAEWRITPMDANQPLTLDDGQTIRAGDLYDIAYFAPAIGTQEGFNEHDGAEYGGRPFVSPSDPIPAPTGQPRTPAKAQN